VQLFEEKLGMYKPEVTQAMQYGTDTESTARQSFCDYTGIFMVPCVKVHGSIPYMACSLDGLSECGTYLLEIKCNGFKNHSLAKQQMIPTNHYAQVQHQLEVTGCKKAYYYSYVYGDSIVVEVDRDQKFIDKLLLAEKEFWTCVEDFTPPPMTDRDYTRMTNPTWLNMAQDWQNTSQELKVLQEKERDLRDQLISLSQGKSSIGGGIKLSKRVRKGAVDYTKIKELENVDLECYRKQNTEYWVIGEG
jgi:putative phage-type endonuclease